MEKVKKILQDYFQKDGWHINTPRDGWEQNSFIGEVGQEKYFIKFGIDPAIIHRLSVLEVTGHVIATGELGNETYMIQEFIKSTYAPVDWFKNNLRQLADFVSRYQNDKTLLQIIQKNMPEDNLSIEGEVDGLLIELNKCSTIAFPEVRSGIMDLKEKYKKYYSLPLKPVHDDPNTKNIFLVNRRLQMVDWNNIRLSDSLSDVGAILWWYVPKNHWGTFFNNRNGEMSADIVERIYLAAAKMSLGMTMWYIKHDKEYQAAFNDFLCAVEMKENPRAWYR